MTSHLTYLAANERATDMRRAAAEAHLAAMAKVPKERPLRADRRVRPAWWQLHRRITTT